MVKLCGSGDGVAPGGVGVGAGVAESCTLDAVSEVAQLPVPLAVTASPVAGFAPAGENEVDELVYTCRFPQPLFVLTANAVLLMIPVTTPLIVSADPF